MDNIIKEIEDFIIIELSNNIELISPYNLYIKTMDPYKMIDHDLVIGIRIKNTLSDDTNKYIDSLNDDKFLDLLDYDRIERELKYQLKNMIGDGINERNRYK